ncbi:MAG: metal-dependent transcriptional regulator [Armatimonadetes bacterium]|nr:metal-dependent transcriptional regulator [Armatimonadota bacterium]
MATPEAKLSRSLEDYLEAIYNLKVRNQFARVKDIARLMEVKMPSVTEAIRSLTSRGLVKHQPYENVELTEEGLDRARGIAHRHSAVKEFLTSVLGLNESDAETEACGIEHAIRPDTLDKLLKFVDFVRACGGDNPMKLDDFKHYIEHNAYPDGCDYRPARPGVCGLRSTITSTKMSDLCPGMTGRIAFVSGKGQIRKRLMEMGLTSDTKFEVIRVAPLGDPVEIKIRGYHLSLRKNEAHHIEVELE